jgi:PAS domain S-box-containing protein
MLNSESKKKLIEQDKATCHDRKRKFGPVNSDSIEHTNVDKTVHQNEQLYRTIFEDSRDAIFIAAEDSRFVTVNEAASVLTGYSREELKKMTIPDLHEEEDMHAYRQFFRRIMSGEQITSEAKILRKNGTKVETEFSNRRIMIDDVAYMHTVARDITERKEAEKALQKSEEQFKAVFYNTLVGLYRTTPDGRILMANPVLIDMLGCSSFEELSERNLENEGYEPQYPRSTFKELIKREGKVIGFESAWKRSDGTTLYVRESAQAIGNEFGKVEYYQGTVEDITDHKKAEEALKYRVEFEDLISIISTRFIGLAPDEIENGIEDALQAIGEFADVDSSYVFLLSDDGKTMDNTQEWCAEGIEPQKENLKGLPVDVFSWGMEKLKSSENIHVPRVADLPPGAKAEREFWQSLNIQSIVVVPMICSGELIGFLGFDSERQERTWSADVIALLRIVGEAFANALVRKRTEEELLFKTALLEAQSETSIDGILIVDDQGKAISSNEQMKELWNVPQEIWDTGDDEKLLQHAVGQLENADEFLEKVRYLYAHKEKKSRDEIALKDGKYFDRYSSPLVDLGGKYHGRIWYFRDISERRKAEEALRKARDELVKANEELCDEISKRKRLEKILRESEKLVAAGQMTARIAHEINNPLAGIKNSFLLIKDAISHDHRYFEYVGLMDKEISRVTRIVRQMFDLYRPGQESPGEFHLSETINDIVALLKVSNVEREVNIEVNISDDSVIVTLTEALFRQILYNLIQNAIEASPPSETVKVSAIVSNEQLILKVSDQGSGIEADIRERIFEPFFTSWASSSTSGLGLGLSICKDIVDAMEGAISFESEKGSGTTFFVVIPFSNESEEQEDD